MTKKYATWETKKLSPDGNSCFSKDSFGLVCYFLVELGLCSVMDVRFTFHQPSGAFNSFSSLSVLAHIEFVLAKEPFD